MDYINRLADEVEWRREALLDEATRRRQIRQARGQVEKPLAGLPSLGDWLPSFRMPVRSRQVP